MLKDTESELQSFEDNRLSIEANLLKLVAGRLAEYRIFRQAFHSRTFIGPHIKMMCRKADEIMGKIRGDLKAHCRDPLKNPPKIDKVCDAVTTLLKDFNKINSYTMQVEMLSEEDLADLEKSLNDFSDCW